MHLNTHFLTLAGSDKVLLETYSHYFEKISQSLLSTSDCIFEVSLLWPFFHLNFSSLLYFYIIGGIERSSIKFPFTAIAVCIICLFEKLDRI